MSKTYTAKHEIVYRDEFGNQRIAPNTLLTEQHVKDLGKEIEPLVKSGALIDNEQAEAKDKAREARAEAKAGKGKAAAAKSEQPKA